ncbi:MAG: hypothetical protein HC875_17785 [Anaerolineales bacterium]|nr:hypothetical protein [Anaerolineales bacterium]
MSKRVTCQCGYKMPGSGAKGYYYYVCPGTFNLDAAHQCNLPRFRSDRVDDVIWQWVRGFFDDEKLVERGVAEYQARQAEIKKPLGEELALINETIKERKKELADNQRALKLLGDDPPQRTLANTLEDIRRVEAQLDGLEEQKRQVEAKIENAETTERDIRAAIDRMEQVKAEIEEGLNLADVNFEDRRFLIERLNVEITLRVENGEKIVEARCYLDDKKLSMGVWANFAREGFLLGMGVERG